MSRNSVGRSLGRSLGRTLRLSVFAIAGLFAVLAAAPSAQAANFLERNFWLSGPRWDGQLPECGWGLNLVALQFAEKEKRFWNSALEITAYQDVRETAFRPWQSNNIPRRYCTARAAINDGVVRTVNYSIIEDGILGSSAHGVEWCVVGLDRDWAYNPACKAARP